MKNEFQDILAENTEVIIDSLIKNEIVKSIPILGTSLKIIRGVQSMREIIYINRIKRFIEVIGEFSEEERLKLIKESEKDAKSKTKLNESIFKTIEQSESEIKVEYLAYAFKAFLNDEIDNSDLRNICHSINICFSDLLISVIEEKRPSLDLKLLVPSGLIKLVYLPAKYDSNNEPSYELSKIANKLRNAFIKYKK